MHYLWFLILGKENYKDPNHARKLALSELENQWFFNQKWMFGGWPSDWGVVWWRWSWILSLCEDKRDAYLHDWDEDDCILLDKKWLTKVAKAMEHFEYKTVSLIDFVNDEFWDWDATMEDIERMKWNYLVVIDYHN